MFYTSCLHADAWKFILRHNVVQEKMQLQHLDRQQKDEEDEIIIDTQHAVFLSLPIGASANKNLCQSVDCIRSHCSGFNDQWKRNHTFEGL